MAQAPGGPANRLERLLQDALQDPGHWPEFYRQLLDADLYLTGGTDSDVPGEGISGPCGDKISMAGWTRDGKTLVPVFTSLERLNESVSQPISYLQLSGRELLQFLESHATVRLNPGCSLGKELPPEEIRSLLDGSLFNPP